MNCLTSIYIKRLGDAQLSLCCSLYLEIHEVKYGLLKNCES